MYRNRFSSVAVAASLGAAALACVGQGRPLGGLPAVGGEGDCYPPRPPSACEWAMSVDAVAFGTYLGIKPVTSPAEVETIGGDPLTTTRTLVTQCDGYLHGEGMLLDVIVTKIFRGSAPASVAVYAGVEHRRMFNPAPYWEQGHERWSPDTDKGTALVPGQTLGLPLRYLPEWGVWSLTGDVLFDFRPADDGVLRARFQQQDAECVLTAPPSDLEGLTMQEFADKLAGCGDADMAAATERRAIMYNTCGQRAVCAFSAYCVLPEQPAAPGTCQVNEDCNLGQTCVAGVCSS